MMDIRGCLSNPFVSLSLKHQSCVQKRAGLVVGVFGDGKEPATTAALSSAAAVANAASGGRLLAALQWFPRPHHPPLY